MATINEQLSEKFKCEDPNLELANGLLEITRPDEATRDSIIDDIRTKIVNQFSSPEDTVTINEDDIKNLLSWQDNPQTEVRPVSTKLRTDIGFQRIPSGFAKLRYPLRNPDGTQIGEVTIDAFVTPTTKNGYKQYVVESYDAHVNRLTDAGWCQLGNWFHTEGLKVVYTNQQYKTGHTIFSHSYVLKCEGLKLFMNKEK